MSAQLVPMHRFDLASGGPDRPQERTRNAALPGGTRLDDDRYELLCVIDKGSTCTMYRARQLRLNRLVAVKMFSDAFTGLRGAMDWIDTEARAIATLNHPSVMQILDRGTYEGRPYLVLELLEGESLLDRISRRGRMPLGEVLTIAADMLSGLTAAHDQGVIHRDIKPQNIMLVQGRDAGGRLILRGKICDFGIAVRTQPKKAMGRATRTQTGHPSGDANIPAHPQRGAAAGDGSVCGTPEYMSPEQTTGSSVDARSDLYAVGITLYHMVTGQVPFHADDPLETLTMQVERQLPIPRELDPCITMELEGIILKATAKAPGRRFESAPAMAEALRRLSQEPAFDPAPVALCALDLGRVSVADPAPLPGSSRCHTPFTDAPTLLIKRPYPRRWLAAVVAMLS